MPLTKEQFQKAREAGFSTEQIIEFEKRRIKEQQQVPVEQITQTPQTISPLDKTIDIIGQFGKAAYESAPFAKRLAQITGTPAEEIYATLPKSRGFLPSFARGLGTVAPDLVMSSPFMRGARLIPKIPSIAKSSLGFGAYGGTKAAIQRQPIIPSALSSAGSAALFHGAGKLGASAIPSFIPGAERIGSALGGGIAGQLTGGEEGMALGAGLGGLYPARRLQESPEVIKGAEALVNYVLKPSKTLKQFGKSPSRAVIKEGLWGRNMADLDVKVNNRLNILNDYKNSLKTEAKNLGITVDLAKNKVFQPLSDLLTELKKAPESHSALINSITKNLNDLLAPQGKFRQLNKISIDEAYEIRDIVNNLKPNVWRGSSTGEVRLASALREVYHNIAETINNSGISSDLKLTNKRISDLISLQDAISDASKRNPSYWRFLPLPLMIGYALKGPIGVAGFLGTLAAETIPGATTIGKMVGGKYPKIPKKYSQILQNK